MFARSLRSAAPVVRALHTSAALRAAEKSAAEVALRNGLKAAMKAKDKPAVHTIKTILSDVTNVAKSGPNPDEPANQESVINAIRKGIEKRVSYHGAWTRCPTISLSSRYRVPEDDDVAGRSREDSKSSS